MSRINGYAPSDVTTLSTASTNKTFGKGAVADPVLSSFDPGTGDAASLSTASTAAAQASAGSDVRADKVAALKLAIAAGSYNVPAGAVAEKLINHLLGGR